MTAGFLQNHLNVEIAIPEGVAMFSLNTAAVF